MATQPAAAETSAPRAPKLSSAASAGKRGKKAKHDKHRAASTSATASASASASAPSSTASREEERAANDAATVDHPYLSFLHKRIRSYRKKLEKIKGLEHAQATDGKVLNAQQAELVGNKALMEKMIAEFDSLRGQFIDVYLEEEAVKRAQEEKQAASTAEAIAEAAATAVTAAIASTEEVGVNTEENEEPKLAVEKSQKPEDPQEPVDEFAHVQELLKALHVVNLHQALGKEVPMVLDFFSKVLLGNTRPPAEISYEENLAESLEEAKKYLSHSDKEFACEMSYVDLHAFVEKLAASSSSSSPMTEQEDDLNTTAVEPVLETTEQQPVTPVMVETLPQINFFTESQLEPEECLDVQEETEQVGAPIESVVADKVYEDVEAEYVEEEPVVFEEQVEVEMAEIPSAPPVPPMSFAAVAAGTSSPPAPSPAAWSQQVEGSSSGTSPQGKSGNSRRRAGGRGKKEGSRNSSSGSSKSSDGFSSNRSRRTRPQRTNDDGGHGSGPKDGRRQRGERGLRKQAGSTQHSSLVAPQA